MNDFAPISKRQQKKLPLGEFEEYKKRERAYYYQKGDSIRGLLKCKIWHYILLGVLKVLRTSKHQKLHILADHRVHKKEPAIYACTHIGYDDAAMTFEALKSLC